MKLAEDGICQILQAAPDLPEALHLQGLIYHQTGKSDLAIASITRAVSLDSRNPEYHYNLGVIHGALGKIEEATRSYHACLCLKPDCTDALNNLGLILFEQDRLEESTVLFQQAIRADPEGIKAWYNLGMALHSLGRPADAIEAYDQVLRVSPDSAETHFNRSISLLTCGKFEEGWQEYEWRFRPVRAGIDDVSANRLAGRAAVSLHRKRILVNDEQGIGDTLQFIRYLPMLKARGGTVVFETSKPLKTLLDGFPGLDELVTTSAGAVPKPDCDFFVPLMSLPCIFKTTLETIPARIPYIFADCAKAKYWRHRIRRTGFNVGIVWSGNPAARYQQAKSSGLEHVNLAWAGNPASKIATGRSNRLEYFTPLADIRGIQLYGLQKGAGAKQADELSGLLDVVNLGEEFEDFSDTAGVIANMDLIVTVDTSVAHLAGAMGKPVWVLIPAVPDWRWMLEREDSPWYPTMRLFRQQDAGDWRHVFARVAKELEALISE